MRIITLRMSALALVITSICAARRAAGLSTNLSCRAGGSVNVGSVSGNVIVTAYDGDAVIISARKEGRDLDKVTSKDRSSAIRVDVRDRYPERLQSCDVSVHYEVKIPRKMQLRYDAFSSVSGNVEVTGASGELHAKSVSGEVKVQSCDATVKASSVSGNVEVGDNQGMVNANSVSGNVNVQIDQLPEGGDLKFTSVSGNVNVRVPGSLNAEVEMSSMSGSLKPISPSPLAKGEFNPRHSAAVA